ncbi:MAG: hypothetical protein R6U98_22415 [Pirellulaceae bacterium]
MIGSKAVRSMALVIVTVAGVHGVADEPTASRLYGQGVHAYFAGDYETAISLLNKAIENNEGDPRAYFFRGLALAARDGLEAGLADFAKGAELEANPVDERVYYDVDEALQRVQGRLRLAIEEQRAAARQAAAARKKKQARVRYERLKRREDVVLIQPDQTRSKSTPDVQDLELPEVDLGDHDPFATGAALVGGEVVESVTPSPPEPAEETEAEPAEEPSEEPSEKPSDPFADLSGMSDTPEDDTAATDASSPSEKPSAASSPFEDDNPFGDDLSGAPSDNPIVDENVAPKLPAGMNMGGNIMEVLERTLSGAANQSSNRDPFSDDEPAVPSKKKPAPAKSVPEQPAPAKEPIDDDNPFDNPFD